MIQSKRERCEWLLRVCYMFRELGGTPETHCGLVNAPQVSIAETWGTRRTGVDFQLEEYFSGQLNLPGKVLLCGSDGSVAGPRARLVCVRHARVARDGSVG